MNDYHKSYNAQDKMSESPKKYQELLSWLIEYLPRTGKILDAGCGPGFYAEQLKKFNENIICLDFTNIYENNESELLFCLGSISSLPIKSNSIDLIYCLTVLQYIEDDANAINEFYRILKPKGKLLITVPTRRSPFWLIREMEIYFGVYPWQSSWNVRPYQYYTRKMIGNLVENKFDIIEIRGYLYNFFPRLKMFFLNLAKKNRYFKDFFSKFILLIKRNLKTEKSQGKSDYIFSNNRNNNIRKRQISKISDLSYHYLIVLEKC